MTRLVFLGTGSGASRGTKRFKSSVLIDSGSSTLLLDAGSGSNFRLEDLNLTGKLDSVFLTHLHIDHIAGILEILVQRSITGAPPLKVYGPTGTKKYLDTIASLGNQIHYNVFEADLPQAVVGNVTVRSVRACHAIYAVSYMVEVDGKRILYSGDTAEPCEGVMEYAKSANLIIHEVSCLRDCSKFGHTSAMEIASLFPGKRVIATHIPVQLEREIGEEVKKNGIEMAEDGKEVDV